jgi:hypothetical protein
MKMSTFTKNDALINNDVSVTTSVDLTSIDEFIMGGVTYVKKSKVAKPTVAPLPKIKNVIFTEDATIVVWSDKTKTIVHCQIGDSWDDEKGVLACIVKKAYGNKGSFNKIIQDAVMLGNENFDKQCTKKEKKRRRNN